MSFPNFRNFQITEKRLTLRKNERHFRTQRTKKHQETSKNQNKKNKTKNLLPSEYENMYKMKLSVISYYNIHLKLHFQ